MLIRSWPALAIGPFWMSARFDVVGSQGVVASSTRSSRNSSFRKPSRRFFVPRRRSRPCCRPLPLKLPIDEDSPASCLENLPHPHQAPDRGGQVRGWPRTFKVIPLVSRSIDRSSGRPGTSSSPAAPPGVAVRYTPGQSLFRHIQTLTKDDIPRSMRNHPKTCCNSIGTSRGVAPRPKRHEFGNDRPRGRHLDSVVGHMHALNHFLKEGVRQVPIRRIRGRCDIGGVCVVEFRGRDRTCCTDQLECGLWASKVKRFSANRRIFTGEPA